MKKINKNNKETPSFSVELDTYACFNFEILTLKL